MISDSISTVKSVSDFNNSAERWLSEISIAEKEMAQYHERCKRIVKRYRDERSEINDIYGSETGSRYNIFWSNIQTLQPAVYSQQALPQVERRFKDNDPVGRLAAEILERVISFQIQDGQLHLVTKLCRDDYLIVGRGVCWLRYLPHYSTTEIDGVATEQVSYEEVKFDYVNRSDFCHNPARVWDEVRWVSRRTFMTQDELIARFGKEVGASIPLDFEPNNVTQADDNAVPRKDLFKKAIVYEIWDKPSRTVVWVNKGQATKVLDIKPDPLHLQGFFPCPRPLYATLTSDSLIPIPDYALYQDQANELDSITARISTLTKALKVAGVYDASCEGIKRLLDEGVENQLIPIPDWPTFSQSNGLDGALQFMPMQDVANALDKLYQLREQLKKDLQEITGLSDIIRGYSAASETATAQRIKGQFAAIRLTDRQSEVARFVRDAISIAGEIIAEHFSEQSLALMSGISLMTQEEQQGFAQAVQLLRNDMLRSFRVDIETDSTISVDSTAEKSNVTEFINSMTGFIQTTAQVTQVYPTLVPLMSQMVSFAARRFKVGRQLEAVVDSAMQQTAQAAQQAQEQQRQAAQQPPEQPQQPDPEMMKLQQEAQLKQAELQLQQQKIQIEQQKVANEAKAIEIKASTEMQINQSKLALEREKLQTEAQLKAYDMQISQTAQATEPKRTQPVVVNVGSSTPKRRIARIEVDPRTGGKLAVVEEHDVAVKRKVARIQVDPQTGSKVAVIDDVGPAIGPNGEPVQVSPATGSNYGVMEEGEAIA